MVGCYVVTRERGHLCLMPVTTPLMGCGIYSKVSPTNMFVQEKTELKQQQDVVGIREKPAQNWPRWGSCAGTLHPYINTVTIMPAEPPALRPARSYQLGKFVLFKFISLSGTFTSLIFPKHSLWRKETYSSASPHPPTGPT